MGSFQPSGILGSIARGGGQVWSANRLELAIKANLIICKADVKFRVFVTSQRRDASFQADQSGQFID